MVGGRSGELGGTVVVTEVAGRVMRSASAGDAAVVLEKWEFLGDPLARRAAAEQSPVVGQVGLVVVTAHHRDLGQAGRPPGPQVPAGPAETQDRGWK